MAAAYGSMRIDVSTVRMWYRSTTLKLSILHLHAHKLRGSLQAEESEYYIYIYIADLSIIYICN